MNPVNRKLNDKMITRLSIINNTELDSFLLCICYIDKYKRKHVQCRKIQYRLINL